MSDSDPATTRTDPITLLKQAIDCVVHGHQPTALFMEELKAVVVGAESKFQVIDALVANQQMVRIARMHSIVDTIESRFLDANHTMSQILNVDPEFALEVLKILTKELGAANDYMKERKPTSSDVADTVDAGRIHQSEAAAKVVGQIPPAEREKLRELLGSISHLIKTLPALPTSQPATPSESSPVAPRPASGKTKRASS